MGRVFHGSAYTTEAVRRAIQLRQETVSSPAKRYWVSPMTIQKWCKRSTVPGAPIGPKDPCSTVLTTEEGAVVVVACRQLALTALSAPALLVADKLSHRVPVLPIERPHL